jgi:hypothetical protein
MEEDRLKESKAVFSITDHNLPMPVYIEVPPKTPYPRRLYVSTREDKGLKWVRIKDLEPYS